MFQKHDNMPIRDEAYEAETIISASVKVEGDFVSQGNVLIEGEVEGSMKTEKDLRVGEQARICADVSAGSATIAGEVRGNVDVSERLKLEPTAKVYGDIRTADLIVASGAVINGKIEMDNSPTAAPVKTVKSSKAAKAAIKEALEEDAVASTEEVVPAPSEEMVDVVEEEKEEEKEGNKKTINAFFTR